MTETDNITHKKLSTLIREGSKLRPQAHDGYFQWVNGELCSCAIGAAFEAATGSFNPPSGSYDWHTLDEALGYDMYFIEVSHPDFERPHSIHSMVVSLNDGAKGRTGQHTREEIADWLESIGL